MISAACFNNLCWGWVGWTEKYWLKVLLSEKRYYLTNSGYRADFGALSHKARNQAPKPLEEGTRDSR